MIKFKKPATGKPYKLAYNAGDVVDLGAELEAKLIEDGYAVPYVAAKAEGAASTDDTKKKAPAK